MPNSEKEKGKQKWLNIWGDLTSDKVRLSIGVLVITLLLFLAVYFLQSNSWKAFVDGIFIELFGILFDVIVLVLLFNWLNSQGEKRQKIERYKEELDDYKEWVSEESKFRKRGLIKRLNKEGVTKFELSIIDLSGDCKKK